MANEPEVIRDQMQETRTALTEKLHTLQQKVTDTVESITTPVTETVQTVKEAVTGTVETVKETVSGTVETVKETFDLRKQVEQRPWAMMAGSFATGFLLGKLLPSPFERGSFSGWSTDDVAEGMSAASRGHNGHHRFMEQEREPPRAEEKGMFSGLAEALGGEVDKLKGLAISVGVGLLRDLLTQSAQGEIGDRIKGWMDDVTQSLGGKPIKEPLVTPKPATEEDAYEEMERATQDKADLKRASSRKGKAQHGTTPRW
jgi:ElaB/YqjD/DUF883 family membrane-anchored ribosome-binding protein